MTFKANKNGTWVGGDDQSQGTVVYGKSGDNWLYAKSVWANKDGSWTRAWTDCRKYDAGGRDWSPPVDVVTYSPDTDCGNRTQTTTTTRTKTGCPDDVRPTTVSSPNCNSGCFDASTSTVYSGSCTSRTSATRTTYTAKAGSGCTTYFVDGTYTADPTCDGACTTVKTGNFTEGGVEYYYTGPAGYYEAFMDGGGPSGGCPSCPPGFYNYGYYYITTCGVTNYIQTLYCIGCQSYFG